MSRHRSQYFQQLKSLIAQRYDMVPILFHALSRYGPLRFLEVDFAPFGGSGFSWADHSVQLPFDQTASHKLSIGVLNSMHERWQLFGFKRWQVGDFGSIECFADTSQRVGMYDASVDGIYHNFIDPTANL